MDRPTPPVPPGFRQAFNRPAGGPDASREARLHPAGQGGAPAPGAHILEPRLVEHKTIMVVASRIVTGWQVAGKREADGTQPRARVVHLQFAGRWPNTGDDAGMEAILPLEEARALHAALGSALAHIDAEGN